MKLTSLIDLATLFCNIQRKGSPLNLDQWDTSIGDLYQSILQPALLAPTVTAINRMMDSDFCHLFGLTPTGEQTFLVMSDASHADTVQKYSERYWEIDPRRSFVDALPPGKTFRCSSICDAAFVSRDAFYQDYLIPHDLLPDRLLFTPQCAAKRIRGLQ